MQDILAFVSKAPSPLSLTPTITNAIRTESNDTFSESFFSMILGQLTNNTEKISLNLAAQDTSELLQKETPLTTDIVQENKEKSIDEHLLEDLLSVVNALKSDSQTTTFPTLNASSSLEKILSSESTRQDFANVNSVSDLLDLSKKYNLGLEKISISQENVESLQTKFPTLAQSNFFDDLQTALDHSQTTARSQDTTSQTATTQTNLMSLLTKQAPKTESTSNTSMLSELISKDTSNEPKLIQPTPSVKTDETLKTLPIPDEKSSMVNEKQQNTTIKVAQSVQAVQDEIAPTLSKPLETLIQKVANSNETKKIEIPIQSTTASVQEEPVPTVTATRVNTLKKEEPLSAEALPEVNVKIIKTEKATNPAYTEDGIGLTQKVAAQEENKISSDSSDGQNAVDVKNDLKATAKQDVTTIKQTSSSKESLNQFASDLKEKIETYKPPIMKVELALSPKNLGDVDVTLLTRGNNLHVNISSNATTMNLFTQNQTEVKNALVSMGFTNLEMNFSDQNNKEQAQENAHKNNNGNFEEFTTDGTEEKTMLMEIIIPQYV